MIRLRWRIAALAMALTGCAQGAFAQPMPGDFIPARRVTDARGVDLVSGGMAMNIPLVSFGEGATSLKASIDPGSPGVGAGGPVINDFLQIAGSVMGAHILPGALVTAADGSSDDIGGFENFVFPNGAGFAQLTTGYNAYYRPPFHTNPDGSTYSQSFGTSHFTRFYSTDPNVAGVYDAAGDRALTDPGSPSPALFDRIIMANGEEIRFYRQYLTVPCTLYCLNGMGGTNPTATIARLRFITSSRGYGIQFLYQSDATPAGNGTAGTWWGPRRVTAYNKASTYCNEAPLQECAAVSALPSAEITYDATAHTVRVTQPGATEGVELIFTAPYNYWVITGMRHSAVPNSTVSFETAIDNAGVGYISRVTDSDGQWNYLRYTYVDDSGHIPLMWARSTNPDGGQVAISGYGQFGTIQTFTDELGRMYNFSDGFPFRDSGRSEPEWNETAVGRDERNNITSITRYPKPNQGNPMLVYQASYPVDCMNPRTCNHPTSVTDGNTNTWAYNYAPEHGGVLTETGPLAPTRQNDGSMADVRPQKRYEYTQRYAWISDGSGGYMHGPTAIWLLTRERRCITTAASGSSCAGGAADEVVTDYDYGPDTGPNSLNLRGVAVTAYLNGAPVTQRTCYGYDSLGRRVSETQPNANLESCP